MTKLEPAQSTKKHIRGSTMLFGGRLISVGMKFFLQILIVRYLAKAEYGAFAYAVNLVEIAAILSLVSLEKSASRFMPIYDEQQDYPSLFGFMMLSVVTIIGMGIALIVLSFGLRGLLLESFINDPLAISLLLIMIVLAPLQAFDSWFQAVFAVFASVRAIFFRRYLLWPGLQLAAIVFVIATQSDVYALAWGYVVGGVIGTTTYAYMSYHLFRRRGLLPHFSIRTLKFNTRVIFAFSLPMLFSAVVFIFRDQMVVVFLGFFGDSVSVAEYRAVAPVARLNSVVYASFGFLYMPLLARMLTHNQEAGINDLFWRTTTWISMASLPIFLITFALADPFVRLLFGQTYANSGIVMSILAVGYYFNAVLGFNVHTLRIYGTVRYLLVIDFVVMIVAVTAYVVFIPQYGAIGGALAYTGTLIIYNVLNHMGLMRYTKINIFDVSYALIYIMIVGATLIVWLMQAIAAPSLLISIPVAVLLSFALLYLNRAKLQVGEIFPELLKVPILGKILRV